MWAICFIVPSQVDRWVGRDWNSEPQCPQGPLTLAPSEGWRLAYIPQFRLTRKARPQNHSPNSQARAEYPGLRIHLSSSETLRKRVNGSYALGTPSSPFSSIHGASACGFLYLWDCMTDRKLKAGAENEMKPEDLRNGWVMRSWYTGEGIPSLDWLSTSWWRWAEGFLVLIHRRPWCFHVSKASLDTWKL